MAETSRHESQEETEAMVAGARRAVAKPFLDQIAALAVERNTLQEKRCRLWEALRDIAGGHAPSRVLSHVDSDTSAQFRTRMWSWSQERAREAIHADSVPTTEPADD